MLRQDQINSGLWRSPGSPEALRRASGLYSNAGKSNPASGWVLQSNRKPLLSGAEVTLAWRKSPGPWRSEQMKWCGGIFCSSFLPPPPAAQGRSIHIYTSFVIHEGCEASPNRTGSELGLDGGLGQHTTMCLSNSLNWGWNSSPPSYGDWQHMQDTLHFLCGAQLVLRQRWDGTSLQDWLGKGATDILLWPGRLEVLRYTYLLSDRRHSAGKVHYWQMGLCWRTLPIGWYDTSEYAWDRVICYTIVWELEDKTHF